MSQASFVYAPPANDGAGLPLAVSIFADRGHVRATLREDAEAAGLRVVEEGDVSGLLDGEARPLGDVVQIDCPVADAALLAALARLDLRAAHCGAHLIVSTSVAALDAVFACMDQSAPQFLVEPTRADRVIALGRLLARHPGARVRELTDDDRMMLIRLTEQVGEIARQINSINRRNALDPDVGEDGQRLESPAHAFNGKGQDEGDRLVRVPRPPLPDPRLVRRIIRQRQLRARFFDGDLFADPAWDMLLDLAAARVEHVRVSVSSLCIASGVPPTTALRWIGQMTEAGLFERVEDEADRRRAFITLSDSCADAMARYFAELGTSACTLV